MLLILGATMAFGAQGELEQGLKSAQEMVEQNDLKGAERKLLYLARTYPHSFIVHNNLGAIYMQQEKYAAAYPEFRKAADLNPKVADIQRNLGACLFQMNKLPAALGPLERAKALDPSEVRTRYLLGYSLLLLGRTTEAERELEYVHARLPGEERTLFALVKVYQQDHDQVNAASTYAELQRAHPDSVYVHILMGESYDIQEKPDEAMAEFRKAIAMAPSMPRLHFDLGFLLWGENQFSASEVEFQQELRVNPDFAPIYYYLGDIALSENRTLDGEKFFRKALELNPSCVEAQIGLGKAFFRLKRFPEALEKFQLANQSDPERTEVIYWLAMVYRRLHQDARSEALLKQFEDLSLRARKVLPSQRSVNGRLENPTCLNPVE